MKKLLIYIISIIFLATALVIIYARYSAIFKVENKVYDIEAKLEEKINKDIPIEAQLDIEVKKTLDVDNKKYVLFTYRNNTCLGSAELIRGWNSKYKINSYGYGNTMLIDFRLVNEKQLIICAINPNKRLQDIKVWNSEHSLSAKAPDEEYFILSIPLEKKVSNNFPTEYQLLDRRGADITMDFVKFSIGP